MDSTPANQHSIQELDLKPHISNGSTESKCKRCNHSYSIPSLHDGYCFDCQVEIFKQQELKKLGFDYILPVLAQEAAQ